MRETVLRRAALAALCAMLGGAVLPARAANLSKEAEQALARARASVQDAAQHGALWTVADQALKDAEKAAGSGDSDSVIRDSERADALAKLGIGQTHYGPVH